MLILPQSLFITKLSDDHHYLFELKDETYQFIETLFHGKVSKFCGYYRHCKDGEGNDLTIIIPRLIVRTSSSAVTHVVLPDFLLPHMQYSLKAVTLANSEHMSSELNRYIEKYVTLWDLTCDELSRFNKKRMTYLQRRFSAIICRIRCFIGLVKSFNFAHTAKLLLHNCFAPFYFFNEKQEVINPIFYLDPINTISPSG